MDKDAIFNKIADLVADEFDVDRSKITGDLNFKNDLDADSIDFVEFVLDLEDTFNAEISDEDAADGVMFQAQDPDSEEGVNMVVTATDVGTEYDLYSMADELATEYEDVEKVCINGLYAVSFETESTYGIAFLEDAEGMMYNVQIGPKSDDIQPIAETLFVSLIKTEDNVENAEAETDAAADEEAAN